MAKRANSSGGSVNLFPFLSILICIIGCLTLIIVVINLIAMGKGEGRTSEEVERAQEYLLIKKEEEEKQVAQDKLRIDIENIIQQNKDILTKRDKLVTLKSMLENQEEIDKSREELIAKFNLLKTTNKKLVADELFLQEEIKKKEAEIAKRETPPQAAALQVRPSGSSTNTKPFFAEISDRGVYLHRSLTAEPVAIPVSSLNQSEEFINLLKAIAKEPYNRLIFLVRGSPGAVKTLNDASQIVSGFNRANGTEIIPGRLPLPGEGKVDLKMFAQFLEP
ncbi:MAG TPA: hypothetical protein PK648_01260 [Verrucomicrobiales bacterium]|nr:hypothetical protein [Verrucomicrobiales bacterium]